MKPQLKIEIFNRISILFVYKYRIFSNIVRGLKLKILGKKLGVDQYMQYSLVISGTSLMGHSKHHNKRGMVQYILSAVLI